MTKNIIISTIVFTIVVLIAVSVVVGSPSASPTQLVLATSTAPSNQPNGVSVVTKPTNTSDASTKSVATNNSVTSVIPSQKPVVLGAVNPISKSGIYDMYNTVFTGTSSSPILTIIPSEVDIRLDSVFNPSLETIVWDPKNTESFERDGAKYIKVYRIKSADEIYQMNYADRKIYTVFVDESKIKTIENVNPISETEKVFVNRFNTSDVRSFDLLGKISDSVYQFQISFMAISNPMAANHDLVLNGHKVHYIDILVYIPGKGLVKQGLAVGVDDEYDSLFRGTDVYTQTSKTDNYLGMFTVPTKIIFEDDNIGNYNTAFTSNKWFISTDINGMPLQEFAISPGDTPFQNMHIGEDSIKYLPFLPKDYYTDFLKSGGESFVVFFPGGDVNGSSEFVGTFERQFSLEEIDKIRSEWDKNGKWLK